MVYVERIEYNKGVRQKEEKREKRQQHKSRMGK
jgi:hypothetical protein